MNNQRRLDLIKQAHILLDRIELNINKLVSKARENNKNNVRNDRTTRRDD